MDHDPIPSEHVKYYKFICYVLPTTMLIILMILECKKWIDAP